MARRCDLSGKNVMVGNNVSHAHNRTRRRFIPNLQNVRMQSEILGQQFKFKICTSLLKTIDKNGGLDNWLLKQSNRKLTDKAMRLKKMISQSQGKSQEQSQSTI
ncbi:MAG: 50S ribosomal protein L28 [Alphaproteobacteria bacterium]|nr:50S ribosomal protein L28 [Alphaproteobacteria bacterium]